MSPTTKPTAMLEADERLERARQLTMALEERVFRLEAAGRELVAITTDRRQGDASVRLAVAGLEVILNEAEPPPIAQVAAAAMRFLAAWGLEAESDVEEGNLYVAIAGPTDALLGLVRAVQAATTGMPW